jgi:hypothetical protein
MVSSSIVDHQGTYSYFMICLFAGIFSFDIQFDNNFDWNRTSIRWWIFRVSSNRSEQVSANLPSLVIQVRYFFLNPERTGFGRFSCGHLVKNGGCECELQEPGKTAYMGCIGDDEFGKKLTDACKKDGMGPRGLLRFWNDMG